MVSLFPSNAVTVRLAGFAARLTYIPQTLRLVWQATGYRTAVWLALLSAQGLLPVAVVYLTRLLVNRITAVLQLDPPRDWLSLAGPLVGFAAVILASEIIRLTADYLQTVQADELQDHINELVHAQSTSVDLAFYEWPDFYDHLHRAQSEATYRPVQLLGSLGSLLQSSITLIAMAAILIPYGWWLPLLLLLSALPVFWCVVQHSVEQYRWRRRMTAEDRRARYLSWLMTSGEAASEIRLYGLQQKFQQMFNAIRERLRREAREMARRQSLARLIASLSGAGMTGVVLLWILRRALRGQATLGDLAFFYQAFSSGQKVMHTLLQQLGQLYYNTLFLGSLYEFLSLRPEIISPPSPAPLPTKLEEGFSLENVTFSYPHRPAPVLKDFHLEIPAGQFVALVGPNGAGKSTIVKLLCRLYDPQEGRITCEGHDLRAVSLQELRERLTVLFQLPLHFDATVDENIAWGRGDEQSTREEVRAAARAAGAAELIESLPNQYDQMLGTWFDGARELSVGEWQRVALARAFLRDAQFIILDEPTSAMDPWAEVDWLKRFRQLSRGRTVLLITHRFTSAMHADTIHVVEDGCIVESGTHAELVQAGGRYSQSWKEQMRSAEQQPLAPGTFL